LNADDDPNSQNNTENSFHVVVGSATDTTTILDGFTITGGNADESNPSDRGGGMYNYSGNPTIANCTFINNWALYGGGIFNNNSSPAIHNCIFTRNNADLKTGGGIGNYNNSNPTVTNCVFNNNSAAHSGGGMYNINSSPLLTNCTFSGNSAIFGAGLHNEGLSNDVTMKVTLCTFINNSAVTLGGGIHNYRGANPMIMNCIISQNKAALGGGIASADYAKPIYTNCTITDNQASSYGGGGVCHGYPSWPTFSNCIIWGNVPDDLACGDPNITYSDIKGEYSGIGNINADPLFADGYHLQALSPCMIKRPDRKIISMT